MTSIRIRPRLVVMLVASSLVVIVSGCSSGSDSTAAPATADGGDVVRMWIGPELAACVGVAPMECMQVSYTEGGEPQLFYQTIDGFDYAEGTSYVIDVQVSEVASPPADASSLSYSLVTVVSETPGQ